MASKDGPATGAERVRDHHERQRKRGLKLIRVWVPGGQESAEQVRRLAADLRKKAGIPLLHDPEIPASPKPHAAPKPQRKRSKRRAKGPPSDAKPAKKATRTQDQNQPKTPKKKRRQRRRKAEKAARSS